MIEVKAQGAGQPGVSLCSGEIIAGLSFARQFFLKSRELEAENFLILETEFTCEGKKRKKKGTDIFVENKKP